jgi:hypothetical protein
VSPERYVAEALARGELRAEHVVELARAYQRARGLVPDGRPGPITVAALERDLGLAPVAVSADGWLSGDGVERLAFDASWYGGAMPRGPLAIVAHYTDTAPGTAVEIAERRAVARGLLLALQEERGTPFEAELPDGRKKVIHHVPKNTSWHLTVCADGRVLQHVPLGRCARHVGPGRVRGLPVNQAAVGIELEGDGSHFPEAQVRGAMRAWRAVVRAHGIARDLAMLEHSRFDPKRRADPGRVWMDEHAPFVLAHALA